jgi:thymidylate synthase
VETYSFETVNGIYPVLIERIMTEGVEVSMRGKTTRELHPVMIELTRPRNRLVTALGRPVNVAFALAEVIWILTGRWDVEMLAHYNSTIDQFSDDGLRFNAPYGYRLRTAHGYDQIEDAIMVLSDDPGSRQAVLTMWHPQDRGFNTLVGQEETVVERRETKDRACNVLAHPMIRNGALDWLQIVRSNDAMWGTPYNWMQFTHLQEYMARRLGVGVGKYVHVADSLHIYDYHYDEARAVDHFDLYQRFGGYSHQPMVVRDNTLNALIEHEMHIRKAQLDRLDTELSSLYTDDDLGPYWANVLQVLLAHRLYKDKRDEECLRVLRSGDAVYSAAQMRFYHKNRWHNMPDLTEMAAESWGGAEIGAWITSGR